MIALVRPLDEREDRAGSSATKHVHQVGDADWVRIIARAFDAYTDFASLIVGPVIADRLAAGTQARDEGPDLRLRPDIARAELTPHLQVMYLPRRTPGRRGVDLRCERHAQGQANGGGVESTAAVLQNPRKVSRVKLGEMLLSQLNHAGHVCPSPVRRQSNCALDVGDAREEHPAVGEVHGMLHPCDADAVNLDVSIVGG